MCIRDRPHSQYTEFHHCLHWAGLLPLSWKNAIGTQELKSSNHNITPKQWARKLSNWFVTNGLKAWHHRNSQVITPSQTTTTHIVLNSQITRLYQLQDELPHYDRDLFSIPLEERLEYSEKQKMAWISTTTQTVYKSIEEHQKKMKIGQQDLRQYFLYRKMNKNEAVWVFFSRRGIRDKTKNLGL